MPIADTVEYGTYEEYDVFDCHFCEERLDADLVAKGDESITEMALSRHSEPGDGEAFAHTECADYDREVI